MRRIHVTCPENRLAGAIRSLHDRYGDFIASLLTYISNELGEEKVEEALRAVFNAVYKPSPFWKSIRTLKHDQIVEMFSCIHRAHYSKFHIEEDDEKTVFVLEYCGSGGRIGKEGEFGVTRKAYPWSFNQKGVNYYCCHCCTFFNNLFPEADLDFIEIQYGRPCRNIIYKRRRSSESVNQKLNNT